MLKQIFLVITLSGVLLVSGFSLAADQPRSQDRDQTQQQIYGSQLMTDQERAEHRARMRAAKSAEEQKQIRKEHHERMKARAKLQGISLPEEPPMKGKGMGPSGGMGQGGGMGPGGGRNR